MGYLVYHWWFYESGLWSQYVWLPVVAAVICGCASYASAERKYTVAMYVLAIVSMLLVTFAHPVMPCVYVAVGVACLVPRHW
jgi:hypothetical protein